ncbi:diaminobutyrate acetyltransferase [Salinibacterium sp. SYSU T00001]|uniref:diaminobutyrate acetyltransferase n=1 Tax=Homoserinimonas sedimenticola TaxID=2986805 RepID=UPI0022365992|nr:diaminobutyrate acetyltransferase [Salinibacterium sedimenticola]MCW4384219.1 diaminobutyrate acetyltransferase [Salinibacterium sedimenticola]
MWRIARDSRTLDLNSSYAYILYARDFMNTCRVAVVDGETAGFVIGYARPEQPDCLFVWQVAVDERFRGLGLAARMLDSLVEDGVADGSIRMVETTITDDNAASQRLFASFAERWGGASVTTRPLFERDHFPLDGHDEHAPEPLYEIGPLKARS